MDAKEFVACWKREKDTLAAVFSDPTGSSAVAAIFAELNLTPEQRHTLKRGIDALLVDTFYTLLLGLDGEASIGGIQLPYEIRDETGTVISPCGEIEAEAYEQFHGGA